MAGINKNKEIRGIYPGRYGGNVWQTLNIDLERSPGRIVLSDKMRRFTSGLGVVSKFIRTNATSTDQWFGIVDATDIIRNGNSTITAGTWVTDDTTGTFNDPRDMVVHENANGEQRLLCSRATDIAILNSSGSANVWDADWYTNILSATALTSLTYHPMARLQRLVAVGDKQTNVPVIHTIDKDDVVSESRLAFSAEYTVRLIITSSDRFWIALQHDYDGNCKIVEWDGFSLTYNREYELYGSFPQTGFVVDDIPYFITEYGFIYKYSGGNFVKVQDFNIQEEREVLDGLIGSYGSWVDGETVYLNVKIPNVETGASDTTLPRGVRRARSGIWIFNVRNGRLYHHAGIGEHASAGTDVNYSTSPLSSVGAVVKADVGTDRKLIASANVYTGGTDWNTNSTNGIYRMIPNTEYPSNAGRNRGYFITPYLPIEEAEAIWDGVWAKFRKFVDSNNRIVIKWRSEDPLQNTSATDPDTNENPLFNAQATWVNTTSFTCKVPTGVAVGDEVEILTGDNGGCSFNISALSGTPDNTTSITVTIDEAAPTSSTDTALVRFDNWNSETAFSDTSVDFAKAPFTSTAQGQFVQLKVELRGMGVEIDDIIPVSKTQTSIKML